MSDFSDSSYLIQGEEESILIPGLLLIKYATDNIIPPSKVKLTLIKWFLLGNIIRKNQPSGNWIVAKMMFCFSNIAWKWNEMKWWLQDTPQLVISPWATACTSSVENENAFPVRCFLKRSTLPLLFLTGNKICQFLLEKTKQTTSFTFGTVLQTSIYFFSKHCCPCCPWLGANQICMRLMCQGITTIKLYN